MGDVVKLNVGDKVVEVPASGDEMYLRWANGDQDAANTLKHIGQSCQAADDLVDDRAMADASGKMTELIVVLGAALQINPFYDKNRKFIEPVIVSSLLHWDLSNTLAKGTQNDRRYAYAFREIIEQTVGIVALLTGGLAHARRSVLECHAYHHVLNLETFEQYEKDLGVS